jgi:hypothetical protein
MKTPAGKAGVQTMETTMDDVNLTMARGGYRELVIADLADSEAALLKRVVELTLSAESYQLLARTAIHTLHARDRELQQLRESHHRLIGEYRRLREQILRGVAA